MKFTTVLEHTRDVDIYGFSEDVEVVYVRFVIEWEVQIETREWGIKDFGVVVTNVAGEYDIETYDDNGETGDRETIEFDFEPYRENCTAATQLTERRQLSISRLEIDLGEKTLEVS